ncbi:hypothetical protein BpHYR1_035872 [Brachionus plicatilis]|uniref:Uncharacterized protein n=1 Tax=Brachionus plicatilis TaxID=10195 RepID=A0A3M7SKK9_BRAPC|nr:hypothetical protein BpHYR1_035872 [Brachionus plicatilis]
MRHEIDKLGLNYIERFQTNDHNGFFSLSKIAHCCCHKSRCHKDKNIIDLFNYNFYLYLEVVVALYQIYLQIMALLYGMSQNIFSKSIDKIDFNI